MSSYAYKIKQMKSNATNGEEFLSANSSSFSDLLKKHNTLVGHLNCDYCNRELLAPWDDLLDGRLWPYLGHQIRRPNSYTYSPIVTVIRKFYDMDGKVFDQKDGNNVVNVHARVHPRGRSAGGSPLLAKGENIRLLCNECFQKTYKRYSVVDQQGKLYDVSITKGESVKSVLKDVGLQAELVHI